jgi:DNA-binding transcriptional ArsR family regulator
LEETGAKRTSRSERKRPADEAVTYAVGNGTRIDTLAILAEGEHSPSEIAEILGVDTQLVRNHVRELFASGCIESAGTKRVRDVPQHFYTALARPHITDSAYEEMSLKARQEVIRVLVQAIVAETMASFRAGKMEADDDVCLMWDCVGLDTRGRRQVSKETQNHFKRILKIEKKSARRIAKSGEPEITTLVALTAFERSRPGRPVERYVQPAMEDSPPEAVLSIENDSELPEKEQVPTVRTDLLGIFSAACVAASLATKLWPGIPIFALGIALFCAISPRMIGPFHFSGAGAKLSGIFSWKRDKDLEGVFRFRRGRGAKNQARSSSREQDVD